VSLLIRHARVVTLAQGRRPRRGAEARNLSVLDDADVLVEGEQIAAVGPGGTLKAPGGGSVLHAEGRVLMPALVDCHTHACWAGDWSHRLDEWSQKLAGKPYLEILAGGGGIMASVQAVRRSTVESLRDSLAERLMGMLRQGTLSVEVKSGYGLSERAELKMLEAIEQAGRVFPGTVRATALLGHALDEGEPGGAEEFVNGVIRRTLGSVHARYPGICVDAFCERGAWSVEDCCRLFEAAQQLGHPVRVHADQFNALGMLERAVKMCADSVDHLEATPTQDLARLARSDTFGVFLPVCGLHLDNRYGHARAFADAGGAGCVATNCNPGSAPSGSMPLAIALGVRKLGLSPEEAITWATVNPATLLRLHDRGTIQPGQRADLLLLKHRDERALAFAMGEEHSEAVIGAGRLLHPPRAGLHARA
jgi:imidazolonepropionase